MRRLVIWTSSIAAARPTCEIQDHAGHRFGVTSGAFADPVRPVEVLHRELVYVDRATDLEGGASLCELDGRVEAVGRHD